MFNFSRENTSNLAKWWRNVDKQILLSIVLLFLLGLFFSFSSTSSLVSEKLRLDGNRLTLSPQEWFREGSWSLLVSECFIKKDK